MFALTLSRFFEFKTSQKVVWVLKLVEELERVPSQYLKKLSGSEEIWEVLIDSGSNTFRILGFFAKGSLVILTNGFGKKSMKTPLSEINLAQKLRKDWLERNKS